MYKASIKLLLTLCLLLLASPAWAAFPVVATSNGGGDSATTTSHTVNLPASIASGDLLLIYLSCRDSNTTITNPAGWVERLNTFAQTDNGAGQVEVLISSRVSDGTEGGSVSVTTGTSVACAYISHRITGQHASSAPEFGTVAKGSSVNPDPPAVTPSWGAEDNLFLAPIFASSNPTVSAYPTSYVDNQRREVTVVASNAVVAVSSRNLNATTDNPGTYTISASTPWGAMTVVVRPAAAATRRAVAPIIFQ